MSPELETLDQLLGGDLPLAVVAKLFPSEDDFRKGLAGLLSSGDVAVIAVDGSALAEWQWNELLRNQNIPVELGSLRLKATAQGLRRLS